MHQLLSKYPYVLCLCLGALSGLCFAPLNWWPLFLLIIPIFYHIVYDENAFWPFVAKFCLFGYSYFFTGLYWISFAMRFQEENGFLYGLISLFGLPLILCVYFFITGCVFYLCKRILPKIICPLIFMFSWIWGEMIRSFLFTGFPWNLIGYSVGADSQLAQIVSMVGIYGLGFLILLMSFIGYYAYEIYKGRRSYYWYIFPLVLIIIFSVVIFNQKFEAPSSGSNIAITIAQPSIDQAKKLDFKFSPNVLDEYIVYSKKAVLDPNKVNILLWPETAIRYDLFNDKFFRKKIMGILKEYDYLITGLVRVVDKGDAYNSLIVIDKVGNIVSFYDKIHLVPFGEYMPFNNYIKLLTFGSRHYGFTEGQNKNPFKIEKVSFLPLICYEAIFSREVMQRINHVNFILNISNDGWYGNTSGPYQHFDMVRFRAIESGKPIIRSANTGISGFIGNKGEVINKLKLNQQGVITLELTFNTQSVTLYATGFNLGIEKLFFDSFLVLVLFLVLVALRRIYVPK